MKRKCVNCGSSNIICRVEGSVFCRKCGWDTRNVIAFTGVELPDLTKEPGT
jgi:hypothetical protein